MIKFVLNKINLANQSKQYKINHYVIFCCVFELTGWDVCFLVTLYLVSQRHQPKVSSRNIWAESLQCTMQKTSWKFPLDFPFIEYLLILNYEKSAKCNPTFPHDKFLSILSKYWLLSKHTALLNKFSFPKKGKNKSMFRMVNLCNGGTKNFVELWEIIH